MTQAASDTSDYQRLDDMYFHLSPHSHTMPFSVCFDSSNDIWVASKGGLLRIGEDRKKKFEVKNTYPKKMAPFPQVVYHNGKIIYTSAEFADRTTIMRIYNLTGNNGESQELEHEVFVDGLLTSLSISDEGIMYITKQVTSTDNSIYYTDLETPIGWEPLITSQTGESFQRVCVLDENTLVAFVCETPLHQFSKQRMVLIDVKGKAITKDFTKEGRDEGKIFFPRDIAKFKKGFLVADKSGRFIEFSKNGEWQGVKAMVDAYLVEGFAVKTDKDGDHHALMAMSGLVINDDGQTLCDDWLEYIKLDGSSWKAVREKKKAAKEAEDKAKAAAAAAKQSS